jgi:hypothetical protein
MPLWKGLTKFADVRDVLGGPPIQVSRRPRAHRSRPDRPAAQRSARFAVAWKPFAVLLAKPPDCLAHDCIDIAGRDSACVGH